MKWLRWEKGRQGGGYEKLMLISNPFLFRFDCYILKFPDGSEIFSHRDPVDGFRHYRLNIILRRARYGGIFFIGQTDLVTGLGVMKAKPHRVTFFRPDEMIHSMSPVVGNHYILSIGWAI